MAKYIIGTKIGMTQMFKEDGSVVPVTVVKIEPNIVVQVKTKEKDGYEAVQIGTGKKKKLTKPEKGHNKELGSFAILKEFRTVNSKLETVNFQVGDTIDISTFTEGETVKVSGISKGKGFQGVVKRHGFHGMPASHGAHSVLRHAGSIGQRFPQHTLKGMRMAGRMGGVSKSIRGLKIIKIDAENQLLVITGSVPGNNGGIVEIKST
ncbi:MAG: 50S ribosomal protein L3 [Candidatus Yanofskybacteria bacterium RIFCSPHIGHO2_01_FULL_41_21]|uniref:Large ribosomal subunit protein uL3 n=1 Tax=Candidatus Yanofskybacteria bacterium RIFCSPHIGHO2_01_FULL_41_21 TaxID=1802660 RepID=A0A1F8EDG9_9BACT|nr:MAG: 50S ribosomal protein L3 [Candidatus Yanofskybacteria bacterium RIFCSPHIGHO2_01_FULL_41_21]